MGQVPTRTRTTRTTFLVGRLTPGSVQIVVVEDHPASPIPGPWTLRGLVRSAKPSTPGGDPGPTVH